MFLSDTLQLDGSNLPHVFMISYLFYPEPVELFCIQHCLANGGILNWERKLEPAKQSQTGFCHPEQESVLKKTTSNHCCRQEQSCKSVL